MERIRYVDLGAQWDEERPILLKKIDKVLSDGIYIGGSEVEGLERDVADYCGVEFAVALNSGTDALIFALTSLGIRKGDEVITPPNSFIATLAAINHVGATPVFVDVKNDQNIDPALIESKITKKTRAILPVHLTGRVADMVAIQEIAGNYNLEIIEDAAQAIGASLYGSRAGSFGGVGCFSTHPLKNLNACGDGGLLVTNREEIAQFVRGARNHGLENRNISKNFGTVSRMDALQAVILRHRLKRLREVIDMRRANARHYMDLLNPDSVFFPPELDGEFHTYHTFVVQVQKREELKSFLSKHQIETAIHYPIPLHLQPASKKFGFKKGDFPVCEAQANEILTLPIHQFLKTCQVEKVARTVNSFF
jgi:dTDP-4-amino-4,6-dideoxygalactose transaminase